MSMHLDEFCLDNPQLHRIVRTFHVYFAHAVMSVRFNEFYAVDPQTIPTLRRRFRP